MSVLQVVMAYHLFLTLVALLTVTCLQLCVGSVDRFTPLSLSISKNMLSNSAVASAVDKSSPVVGGPGQQLHHVAATLSKIGTKIIYLRDRAKHATAMQMNGASAKFSINMIQLVALLVDTWLGRCIMNHDNKQSNDEQLDISIMFLPVCQSEVDILLKNTGISDANDIGIVLHMCRLTIASLDHVAFMSELLPIAQERDSSKVATVSEKHVCVLATSMLNEIITSAKERLSADTEQGSVLQYQIALDAKNAISRITNRMAPHHMEDIVSVFQSSPLMVNVCPQLSSSPPSQREPIVHCVWFLYNHARQVSTHCTNLAMKAVTPTAHSSGLVASCDILEPNCFLRQSAFAHSTIDLYKKKSDLPLLIPSRSFNERIFEAVSLTGSSDPISLTLSYNLRRVRKSGLAEDLALFISMTLFNITLVPIINGVCVDLKITEEASHLSCFATSTFNHEIKGGDFVTWEVSVGNWSTGNIMLMASVTFREMKHESSSHKFSAFAAVGPSLRATRPWRHTPAAVRTGR